MNPAVIFDMNLDGKIDLDDVDLNGNRIVDPEEIIDHMFGWDFVTFDDGGFTSIFLDVPAIPLPLAYPRSKPHH